MGFDLNQRCIAVIFSKDRALQLDGTLRSLIEALNRGGERMPPLYVLYTTTSSVEEASYQCLAREHSRIHFVREIDFKSQLLSLVSGFQYVLFLVDDNIFIRTCALSRYLDALEANPQAVGYSLRLGNNTEYCYALDKMQQRPEFSTVDDETLIFRWVGANHDFGYPLEVSSSIYRMADIQLMLEKLPYRHPNSLEAMFAQCAPLYASIRPQLLCSTESRTFCAPINRVQDEFENRAGESHGRTAAELSLLFQSGYRLDIERYWGFLPRGCHEEVPLYTMNPGETKSLNNSLMRA